MNKSSGFSQERSLLRLAVGRLGTFTRKNVVYQAKVPRYASTWHQTATKENTNFHFFRASLYEHGKNYNSLKGLQVIVLSHVAFWRPPPIVTRESSNLTGLFLGSPINLQDMIGTNLSNGIQWIRVPKHNRTTLHILKVYLGHVSRMHGRAQQEAVFHPSFTRHSSMKSHRPLNSKPRTLQRLNG